MAEHINTKKYGNTKKCGRCKESLPLDQFYVVKNTQKNKNGEERVYTRPHSYCKSCLVEYRRERYGSTDYDQKYHIKNRDRILKYQTEHYEKNREERLKKNIEFYHANRDKYLASFYKWKKENPKSPAAHSKVRRAKKNGTLKVPSECECCGRKIRVEFHHRSYDEPLKGLFLCRNIHRRYHLGINQEAQALIRKLWKEKYNEEYDDFDGEIL